MTSVNITYSPSGRVPFDHLDSLDAARNKKQ